MQGKNGFTYSKNDRHNKSLEMRTRCEMKSSNIENNLSMVYHAFERRTLAQDNNV